MCCLTFFLLTLLFKYRRRSEVIAIFLFMNCLWNRMTRSYMVRPAHFLRVSSLSKKSICSGSSFLFRYLNFFLFSGIYLYRQMCCTVLYESFIDLLISVRDLKIFGLRSSLVGPNLSKNIAYLRVAWPSFDSLQYLIFFMTY